MIKAVIFDFDGVIEDNYELHYQLSKKKTINITREEHKQLFEGNIHIEREKLKHRDTGYDLMTNFSNSKKDRKIKSEIKDLIIVLSEKYILGVITSAKEYGINNYIKANNLEDLFSFIYGYETDKIKVNKFLKVFEEFEINKNECLFVTDTLGDILEANKVGMKTIAVDFGFHERERLEKGNPYRIVSSFEEIKKEIDKLNH